ncbi:DUF3000 domain-containing protein [Microbacterium sp. Marseille-Q6965]|uniref:DUF3000 domain-containing protein n=1 Tax=Microbacterium sp. Marseille-Q6965 TaxID=2965072 RepID=UPI0021B725F1|nr:DUF3000 domain-containing protein [Microbacterium sp. Marseille-Q6965]
MTDHGPVPDAFAQAEARVRAATFRNDFSVREIPSPQGVAPFSLAVAGDVRPDEHGNSPYGTGRFILLHDPDEPPTWGGPFRIVSFAQAPLEPEIGTDPLLADVTWSWLIDALESRRAAYHSASGTATKILSTGFGGLAEEGDGAQIELRASWTPEGDLRDHIEAWAELVCMLAGLPPGSEQIAVFGARKAERD